MVSVRERFLTMGPAERSRASILVVDSDATDRSNLRSCLKSLGFFDISDVQNHLVALERLSQKTYTHIIFDVKPNKIPISEFLEKILTESPKTILIPSSYEPDVDEVFDLLLQGARGYLVKPFTVETVDEAIVNATKGEPIADVVLNAKERNEALVAMLMMSLDVAAGIIRQAYQFETAQREVPRALENLRRTSELVETFAKGGFDGYFAMLEKFCIERSQGPATRLGRLRKRLRSQRE